MLSYIIMKIKETLKMYNMTLNELSLKLFLSRPTLNNYIKQFEEGGLISNENYQVIFKKLFNNKSMDEMSFKKEVENYHLIIGKEKKTNLYEYSDENMNIMDSIIKKMQEDLKGKKESDPLYKFINSAIHNYEVDLVLTAYINYNLYLNGLKDLKKIKIKEKKLISNLFPLMKSYVSSNLTFNENGYSDFLERVNEIKENRIKKTKEFEKKIKEKFEEEVSKKIQQGIDIKSLNIEEILKNIKI